MTGSVNIRKSSRISKNKLTEVVNETTSQSRITEYVNVRKRGTATLEAKKTLISEDVKETEIVGTPVKIKRKQDKNMEEIKASVVRMGMLTPSPSLESINSEDNTNLSVDEILDSNAPDFVESAPVQPLPVPVSPSKSSVPAYKRFAHLVEGVRNQKIKLSDLEVETETDSKIEEPVDISLDNSTFEDFKSVPWLPLNEKWSFYEKLIFNVDSLCVLAAGRSQPCVFHKIQKTLENVLGKQVPIEQMERLKSVWPDVYECRESRVIIQGKRLDSVALSVPGIGGTDSSAALLNERKERVRGRVQKYLIYAHAREFQYPKTEIPKQWNDKFDQNKVKEIPRTSLLGSKSVLSNPLDTPKFINEIMISSPMKSTTNINESANVEVTTKSSKSPILSTKMSLLERIRAKEQALQSKKCFSADEDRIKAILSQMERFTQSIMFTFTSSKKTSLFLTDLTTKLIQSSSIPLSVSEVLERLKMLEKCAPEWIKICDDNDGMNGPKYVKILDKTRTLTSILESLHSKYKV